MQVVGSNFGIGKSGRKVLIMRFISRYEMRGNERYARAYILQTKTM